MVNNNEYKKDRTVFWSIIIVIFIIILYTVGMILTNILFQKPQDIGSSSGTVSTFFTAMAFAGIFITILNQRKELELQKEELKLTRNELNAQMEEFKIQNETLRRQRFENTFFQMVSLQQEIVNTLYYEGKFHSGSNYVKFETKGRDLFRQFYTKATTIIRVCP